MASAAMTFVQDFVYEVFLFAIDDNGWRLIVLGRGELVIIIFYERFNFRGVKDRKDVGLVGEVKGVG
jgi:hypothetical protein